MKNTTVLSFPRALNHACERTIKEIVLPSLTLRMIVLNLIITGVLMGIFPSILSDPFASMFGVFLAMAFIRLAVVVCHTTRNP